MLVIRLPATGPIVQNPIAEARPSCGLKSRTKAGVATRIAPSTRPMAEMTMANPHSVVTFVTPNVIRRPTMRRPYMTTLDRPRRSVWLAGSEANAPIRLETTTMPT